MSPSPASAPRRRGAPDAFGAARLLYEKTAGRSCRRRARTTFHSTTGATALPRAPSDKELRPTGFLPFLDRPPGRSVRSILEHRLDQQPLQAALDLPLPAHPNVRGAAYYRDEEETPSC